MKSRAGIRFSACLALVLALAGVACDRNASDERILRPTDAVTPFRNQHEPERLEEVAGLARLKDVELVFLGDSITHFWSSRGKDVWEEFYGKRSALNLGVGWEETGNILWRIDAGHFDALTPKLIVLMIGTNNTEHGKHTPRQIARGVAAVIDRLHAKAPEAKVLLLGIFPRGWEPDDPYRLNNEATNNILSGLADGEQVFYRDIGKIFLEPNGSLRRDLITDSIHLNSHGYRMWAEAIEEDVARLLDEPVASD